MESIDILILGVEASVAFAGFAGIIATFQFGEKKQVRRGDAVGLTMIVQFSLLAALSSSIPLLLHSFGVKTTTVWTITSAVTAIFFGGGQYAQHSNLGNAIRNKAMKRFTLIIQSVGVGMISINILNVLDLYFHREAGPVIAGIIWALSITGFMFSRLLLQPVWRNVRIQEAAKLAAATAA
ncbi:MAG: hypothetical protein V7746_22485 [Halioglobus sp.]